jgi:hypothetical protein
MVLNYPQIYKTNFGDASIVSHVHEWLELRQLLAGLANLHNCGLTWIMFRFWIYIVLSTNMWTLVPEILPWNRYGSKSIPFQNRQVIDFLCIFFWFHFWPNPKVERFKPGNDWWSRQLSCLRQDGALGRMVEIDDGGCGSKWLTDWPVKLDGGMSTMTILWVRSQKDPKGTFDSP